MMRRKGTLFVITAPSGAGKTTLIKRILRSIDDLEFSVSYTTRDKRKGERDGIDYHFVSVDGFKKILSKRGFLEWAVVFGHYYGTPKKETEQMLKEGKDVILDIDVQGASQVKKKKRKAVFIFIVPPDFKTLKKRLDGRKSEAQEIVARRLKIAGKDIKGFRFFDYLVVNEHLEEAVSLLKSIIRAERRRMNRNTEFMLDLLRTFKK
jgi:guanylate kinase